MQKLLLVIAKIDPNVIQEKVQGADDWKLWILFVVLLLLLLFVMYKLTKAILLSGREPRKPNGAISMDMYGIDLDDFEKRIS